jgi:hypothetical protein
MIAFFRAACETDQAEWPRTENRQHYASCRERFPELETRKVGERVYSAERSGANAV